MPAYSFLDPAAREGACSPNIEAYYSRSWEQYDMPPHFHDRVEIMYVLKGWCLIHLYDYQLEPGTERILLRRHWTERLGAGEFMLLDRDILHRLEVPETSYMLNIEFTLMQDARAPVSLGKLAAASPELMELMTRGRGVMRGKDDSGHLFRAMERVIQELSRSVPRDLALSDVLMAETLLRLAVALKDSAINGNALGYARKAAEYIAAHLDEEMRVPDVARTVGVAPAYLQRVFKQAMNMTMVEYLNRLRIERSKHLLMFTDESILDVAMSVGFNSRQHFFRVFTAELGVSPQQFRQNQRARRAPQIYRFEDAEDHWYDEGEGLPEDGAL